MKRFFALFIASMMATTAVSAADVGLFVRSGTSSITNPVANQTWIFDSSSNQILQWNGSAWEPKLVPKLKLDATADPTAAADQSAGYRPGAVWVNTTSKQVFVCADASLAAAVWYPISNRISAADVLGKFTTSDGLSDYVASGLLATVPGSGLSATTSAGVAYVSGLRVSESSIAFTYSASKDTYEYLQADGSIVRVPVANGDPAPSGQPGLALQKVVSGPTDVTSVSRLASMAPRIKAAAAQAGSEAVNLDQADARYATIGATTPGPANRFWGSPDGVTGTLSLRAIVLNDLPVLSLAKGGSGNAALTANNLGIYYGDGAKIVQMATPSALQKIRSNAAGTALEYAADTNGTVTGVTFSLPSDAFNTNVTGTATQALSGTYKTNAAANRVIGSDASGAVSLMALVNSQMPVLDFAHGGSNNGLLAATQWTVPYMDGTKMVNTPVLAAGQSLRRNAAGTAMEAFTPSSSVNVFGGDGSDGAVTKGAVSETTPIQVLATTFSQTVSTTWQPRSGSIVLSQSTQTYSGTTTVAQGCSGGYGGVAAGNGGSAGSGLGGGTGAYTLGGTYTLSGAGGANAGKGGDGGSNSAGAQLPGPNSYSMSRLGGSGGGGAHYASGTAGGNGGNGGGSFVACAVAALSIPSGGSITCNGATGGSGGYGGGGGAGGTLYLASQTSVSNAGTLSCNGGNGGPGSAGGGGGGGAGGYIFFHSPSNTNGTRNVTAGSAGSTGAGTGGGAGVAGVTVSLTGTPNLPLLISLKNGGLERMKALALTKRVLQPSNDLAFDVEMSQREAALAIAGSNVIQFAKVVDGNMQESSCMEIGDFECLGDAA